MSGRSDPAWPQLEENLACVESRIAVACRQSGRSRSEITLLAVTKGHPSGAILAALTLGLKDFGENRVQEFQAKRAGLGGPISPPTSPVTGFPAGLAAELGGNASFHLIGHLQTNKAAHAVEIFSTVDTVDSLHLAERLNLAASGRKRRLPVLLEIKLSPEPSKTGLDPDSTQIRALLDRMPDLTALELRGLMTVPLYLEDPEAVRPSFARLRALRDRFSAAYPRLNLGELSMGMSHDFAVAIEEGATQVRIGTALFGARPPIQ